MMAAYSLFPVAGGYSEYKVSRETNICLYRPICIMSTEISEGVTPRIRDA